MTAGRVLHVLFNVIILPQSSSIQLFKKTFSKENKKLISQDCKVIWEFFKLANNAVTI